MTSFNAFGISVTPINASGKKIARPEIVVDEHLEYLDNLRESGVTNMFDTGAYLAAEFGLNRHDARKIASYWMQSFDERHP